ncbi:ABC transporter ATP-binding protein [Nocardioides aequoreus]|uniref:ABC transporter ATP-binding protein n=1 Tax=Nocardioides aequoreus TaxID=397278 RepID=UPI0004C41844|nr:ATP-binding cassette domain-containing protein [Nocardioides aequoreus]
MDSRSTGARVEVRGLTKRFGGFTAVDDLTFTVEPGRITGFLGPNGAGKTTTLRMALGLVRPTSGDVLIDGQAYADLVSPLSVVGAALEATNFHPGRSGRDHLRVLATTAGIPTSRVDEMLELTGIPAFARRRAGAYSMGMRQRLALAAALLGDPRVLVLDEPANGLDPEGIRWLRGFLRMLSREHGKTVLVSSHLLQEVSQTADDVVILANGRLVREGTMADLQGEPSVLVRTSDASALAEALNARELAVEPGGDGGLVVRTADPRVVGDVALAAGLPVWELTPQRADLEQLFFSLTEGTNRNLGPVAGATREGAA